MMCLSVVGRCVMQKWNGPQLVRRGRKREYHTTSSLRICFVSSIHSEDMDWRLRAL